ncbi:hypothetical protein Poli38472_004750 [Pythium oligandrum]|uniref:Vacuolar protein 8 n=1 Tax=Pythium oligandrum TaxID=41045 RepID=A0A8K1CB22_PYTOL|nr:hypothetical protein Poli38472_004750 [Pythium oligandrum]|eukprot:TMW59681.1 hypothetical protein Poli38472_004750 [Pythium oligandrum]
MDVVDAISELLEQGKSLLRTAVQVDDELHETAERQLDQLQQIQSLLASGHISPSRSLDKYLLHFKEQLAYYEEFRSKSRISRMFLKSHMERRFEACEIRFRSMERVRRLETDDVVLKAQNRVLRKALDVKAEVMGSTQERPSSASTAYSSPTGSLVDVHSLSYSDSESPIHEIETHEAESTHLTQASPSHTAHVSPRRIFRVLHQLLTCGMDPTLERKALASFDALFLSLDSESRVDIIQAGIIQPLVQQLRESPRRLVHAANALRILSKHPEVQEKMLDADVVQQLVNVVDNGITQTQNEAVTGALEAVAPVSGRADEADMLPALAQLIQSGTDEQKERAVKTLYQFASKTTLDVAIRAHGCIDALASLLHTGTPEQCHLVVKTLRCLAKQPSNRSFVVMAVGSDVEALVEALDAEAQAYRIAGALTVLAIEEEDRRRIGEAGAILPLLDILQDSTDDALTNSAALALCVLANDNHDRILESNGLDVLISALQSPSDRQQQTVARTLGRLATSSDTCIDQMVDLGAVSALMKVVSSSRHPQVKCEAASVLCSLLHRRDDTVDTRVASQIQQVDGVAVLLRVLSTIELEEARVFTLLLLQDVMISSPTAKRAFVHHHGIAIIGNLLLTASGDLHSLLSHVIDSFQEQRSITL